MAVYMLSMYNYNPFDTLPLGFILGLGVFLGLITKKDKKKEIGTFFIGSLGLLFFSWWDIPKYTKGNFFLYNLMNVMFSNILVTIATFAFGFFLPEIMLSLKRASVSGVKKGWAGVRAGLRGLKKLKREERKVEREEEQIEREIKKEEEELKEVLRLMEEELKELRKTGKIEEKFNTELSVEILKLKKTSRFLQAIEEKLIWYLLGLESGRYRHLGRGLPKDLSRLVKKLKTAAIKSLNEFAKLINYIFKYIKEIVRELRKVEEAEKKELKKLYNLVVDIESSLRLLKDVNVKLSDVGYKIETDIIYSAEAIVAKLKDFEKDFEDEKKLSKEAKDLKNKILKFKNLDMSVRKIKNKLDYVISKLQSSSERLSIRKVSDIKEKISSIKTYTTVSEKILNLLNNQRKKVEENINKELSNARKIIENARDLKHILPAYTKALALIEGALKREISNTIKQEISQIKEEEKSKDNKKREIVVELDKIINLEIIDQLEIEKLSELLTTVEEELNKYRRYLHDLRKYGDKHTGVGDFINQVEGLLKNLANAKKDIKKIYRDSRKIVNDLRKLFKEMPKILENIRKAIEEKQNILEKIITYLDRSIKRVERIALAIRNETRRIYSSILHRYRIQSPYIVYPIHRNK